jgi:unsaturated chondroitin disaccharide hydrolase
MADGSTAPTQTDRAIDRPAGLADALSEAMSFGLSRIDDNLDVFVDQFPAPASESLVYPASDNRSWTPGFWPGLCWLAYEYTGADRYRERAAGTLESFLRRAPELQTHDVGFLYTLSARAAADVTDDPAAAGLEVIAADRLADRYLPAPGVLQAWGQIGNPAEDGWGEWAQGRIIVDTMLNLPILFRASAATGNDEYRRIAIEHAVETRERLVREDGSTVHTFKFDPDTGDPEGPESHQGYGPDSCWTRGQAWALYGFALAYRHTGREAFLATARETADYYLARLPEDFVPRWDFDAPEDDDQRDSSAAAIAAAGLLELAGHVPPADDARDRYERAALATVDSLATDYTTAGLDSNGILAHGVYNRTEERGVDECTIWGDYFFMEALTRALTDWEPYW